MKLETHQNAFIQKHLNYESYESSLLTQDASHRRYYRIQKNHNSHALVVDEPFFDKEKSDFLVLQEFLKKSAVRVPEVFHFDAEEGLILIEDLGDHTLESTFYQHNKTNSSAVKKFYELAIDELIKIQKIENPRNKTRCFERSFNTEKFLDEMKNTWAHLLNQLCSYNEHETEVMREMTEICKYLSCQPAYLCHRDYHSRNLMIKNDCIVVIDFQDARLGPLVYDLVSLLEDCYVPLCAELKEDLKKYYLEKATEAHLAIDKKTFRKTYRWQFLQRGFKACGNFAQFFNGGQDQRYLKYLNRTLSALKEEAKDFKYFQKALQHTLTKNYEQL